MNTSKKQKNYRLRQERKVLIGYHLTTIANLNPENPEEIKIIAKHLYYLDKYIREYFILETNKGETLETKNVLN